MHILSYSCVSLQKASTSWSVLSVQLVTCFLALSHSLIWVSPATPAVQREVWRVQAGVWVTHTDHLVATEVSSSSSVFFTLLIFHLYISVCRSHYRGVFLVYNRPRALCTVILPQTLLSWYLRCTFCSLEKTWMSSVKFFFFFFFLVWLTGGYEAYRVNVRSPGGGFISQTHTTHRDPAAALYVSRVSLFT